MTPSFAARRRVGALSLTSAILLGAAAGCAPPSQQDIQTAQALQDLGVAFNDIRSQQQEMQDQLDSLRLVVARRDSVIRILANLAGVPVPP
ncbi:MAG: hypothetical protein ABI910_03340 [Gemmatimonadota bacterium]